MNSHPIFSWAYGLLARSLAQRPSILCKVAILTGILSPVILAVEGTGPNAVDFERQIRPILAEKCLACHGVDQETREAGLRLDTQEGATIGGNSGLPAIIPGASDKSELMRRVLSEKEDESMPPPHSNLNPLTSAEIELLKKWIDAGAQYTQHWAFVPPAKTPIPSGDSSEDPSSGAQDSNAAFAIDFFVAKKLSSLGLNRSPKAESWQLCRRLYLDIIGLPPSTSDLQAFEKDGFQASVEKLLSSERFGEKWARSWLDAARYSDTNGYEKDLRRDQWIWRDWVIKAFNSDMPYDQFIIEQIAGDLLPNATQDQIIATGMLRNSMINEEGAIIAEEFRMAQMFDRMDCIGKSVLGITTQCAQCHSHKFDPLTQEEYYGMFAYLNNTYEAKSWVYSQDQLQKIAELNSRIAAIDQQVRQACPTWQADLLQWCSHLQTLQAEWTPILFDDLNSVSGLNHPVQQADLAILTLGERSDDVYFIGQPEINGATGIRLEVLCHDDLPFSGPGRNSVGGWDIREVEVFIQPPESTDWKKLKLNNPTADFSGAIHAYEDGKKKRGPVAYLIDGKEDRAWHADRGIGRRNSPSVAVLQFEKPIEAAKGTKLKIAMRMNDMVGCCRWSLTSSPDPKTPKIDYAAQLAAAIAPKDRTAQQNADLFSAWRNSLPEFKQFSDQINGLYSQFPVAMTSVLHLKEREPDESRQTHFLNRGEWNRPQHPVQPSVPAAWHPLPPTRSINDSEPPRLRFARWLVDRKSPLAARVAVNRIWQSIFGRGLVETSEDFGTRAPMPEYRELLDWLAVDFMEHGWSTKHLIRQIVSSQTYQQSSATDPQMIASDPDNRLLQRGPRFRADAEVVRDLVMAIAGIIHHELGGPSVIPPVPQNVLDYNYTYPDYWTPATGQQRYRRTVYGFRKRSMPDPPTSSFDAPNGEFSCVRRDRSNTPLAALTGLNEPIFVESAQGLALRLLREAPRSDRERITLGFQLCTARVPTEQETLVLLELLGSQRKRVADSWLNAREIATGFPDRLPDLPEGTTPQDAAVWTLAARVLLNLDETLCKN